jgi:polyisoprenoid-binding protein YceI
VTDQTTLSRPPSAPSRKKRRLRIAAAIAVLVIAAGAALVWWYLRDDAPDAVSITDAAAQVTEPTTDAATASTAAATTPAATDGAAATTAAPATTAAAAAAGDVSGTWTVDTSIGEFNYEDSTGTFVGFRVEEELQGLGSVTAVGRTPVVTGSLEIDGTTVNAVTIEADMSAITTNDGRRDDKVWEALETGTFPTGTFVLTQPIDLGDAASSGEAVSADAVGELTIHGVTLPVTIPLQAQLVGDTIVVVGQADVVFADYGVELPTAPIVLSLDDNGIIELQLFFTR